MSPGNEIENRGEIEASDLMLRMTMISQTANLTVLSGQYGVISKIFTYRLCIVKPLEMWREKSMAQLSSRDTCLCYMYS